MITGRVTDAPEAVVPLRVRGPGGDEAAIQAVLDTGFTHYLTLTPATIRQLHLIQVDTLQCEVADGRILPMETYLAVVLWDGSPRDVLVLAAEGEPLLGMALLHGSRLTLDVETDGSVSIEPLK